MQNYTSMKLIFHANTTSFTYHLISVIFLFVSSNRFNDYSFITASQAEYHSDTMTVDVVLLLHNFFNETSLCLESKNILNDKTHALKNLFEKKNTKTTTTNQKHKTLREKRHLFTLASLRFSLIVNATLATLLMSICPNHVIQAIKHS